MKTRNMGKRASGDAVDVPKPGLEKDAADDHHNGCEGRDGSDHEQGPRQKKTTKAPRKKAAKKAGKKRKKAIEPELPPSKRPREANAHDPVDEMSPDQLRALVRQLQDENDALTTKHRNELQEARSGTNTLRNNMILLEAAKKMAMEENRDLNSDNYRLRHQLRHEPSLYVKYPDEYIMNEWIYITGRISVLATWYIEVSPDNDTIVPDGPNSRAVADLVEQCAAQPKLSEKYVERYLWDQCVSMILTEGIWGGKIGSAFAELHRKLVDLSDADSSKRPMCSDIKWRLMRHLNDQFNLDEKLMEEYCDEVTRSLSAFINPDRYENARACLRDTFKQFLELQVKLLGSKAIFNIGFVQPDALFNRDTMKSHEAYVQPDYGYVFISVSPFVIETGHPEGDSYENTYHLFKAGVIVEGDPLIKEKEPSYESWSSE